MSEKRLTAIIKKFNKDTEKLMRLKTTYYAEAYNIEIIFNDECSKDHKFALKYKKFNEYMAIHVPHFDYMDYLRFKGFFAIDKTEIIKRLDNSSLDYIRSKVVSSKGSLFVTQNKLIKYIDKLPKTDVIDYETTYKIFKDIREDKKKALGQAPRIRRYPMYKKEELNKLTKNDLIDLCMKLQKAANNKKAKE